MRRFLGTRRRPKTALVLGAGGIKSVCHLGLFRALHREKIDIDLVVGSSGGSLFGASYALGTESAQIEHWVEKYWKQEIFQDYGYRQMLKMLSPRKFKFDEKFGIIKGEEVRRIFMKLFGGLSFDDTKIPLRIIASDLKAGEPVVLAQGSLVDAIRASISMPVFFQPHLVDGRYLVDGALCAPIPLEYAIAEGAEVIISMGFANRPHKRIDSPLRLVTQLMKISGTQLYRATVAYYARNPNVEVVPIELELDSALGMRDIDEIPRLIDLGEETSQKLMPLVRRTIAEFHSPKNRLKRRLRLLVGHSLRTSLVEPPSFTSNGRSEPPDEPVDNGGVESHGDVDGNGRLEQQSESERKLLTEDAPDSD
jgi:NTE family protein